LIGTMGGSAENDHGLYRFGLRLRGGRRRGQPKRSSGQDGRGEREKSGPPHWVFHRASFCFGAEPTVQANNAATGTAPEDARRH
jgi:hypothetical protein